MCSQTGVNPEHLQAARKALKKQQEKVNGNNGSPMKICAKVSQSSCVDDAKSRRALCGRGRLDGCLERLSLTEKSCEPIHAFIPTLELIRGSSDMEKDGAPCLNSYCKESISLIGPSMRSRE